MPEYFDISFIVQKNGSRNELLEFLGKTFSIYEGESSVKDNGNTLPANKKIILSVYKEEEPDFDEFCVSFSECIFHKNSFAKELEWVTNFVGQCFKNCKNVEFALCSYELNEYLIGAKKSFENFDAEFLSQFPIVYSRRQGIDEPLLTIHLAAQDILWIVYGLLCLFTVQIYAILQVLQIILNHR